MEWNWITIFWVLSYLIGILALFIIPANRKPGEATAWILLILLAPILGAVLFPCWAARSFPGGAATSNST